MSNPALDAHRFARCNACGICEQLGGTPRPVHGSGDPSARIIVVTDHPRVQDLRNGKLLIDPAGKMMDAVLRALDLSRADVYITATTSCNPLKKNKKGLLASWVDACNPRLRHEIESLPNRHVIIPMGNAAVRAIMGGGTNVREAIFENSWSEEWKAFVIPTYHPGALFQDHEIFPDFAWAFERAKEHLSRPAGPIPQPAISYKVPRSIDEALEDLEDLLHYEGDVTCDIEGDGLDWQRDTLLSIGFTVDATFAYILPYVTKTPKRINGTEEWDLRPDPRLNKLLNAIFSSRRLKWGWHNGKFDIKFLRTNPLNFDARVDEDTHLRSYSLDERKGIHGLGSLACKYLYAPNWKHMVKKWVPTKGTPYSAIPRPVLYQYQAHDLCNTHRLRYKLVEELQKEPPSRHGWPSPLDTHDHLLVPAANELARSEIAGTYIDQGYLSTLQTDMSATLKAREAKLRQMAVELSGGAFKPEPPPSAIAPVVAHVMARTRGKSQTQRDKALKNALTKLYEDTLNVRSPKQVATLMYDHIGLPSTGGRSTNKAALEGFRHRSPFCEEMLQYRLLHRLHSVYVEGFADLLGPDGRIHPEIKLATTRTGRLAGENPAVMTIPRNSPIKKLFAAPSRPRRFRFFQADYKQLEVRVAAWYSEDDRLIEVCKGDVHGNTSEEVFAKQLAEIRAAKTVQELEWILEAYEVLREVRAVQNRTPELDVEVLRKTMIKQLRHMTKYITFGILYGREAKSLAEGELHCSVKEAQRYIDAFFQRFSKVKKFLAQSEKYALTDGWIETPAGRRRRFPFISQDIAWRIRKQADNMPIQSFASDINLTALIRIGPRLREEGLGHILFPVHDAISVEGLEERQHRVVEIMQEEMENVVQDSPVPFPVEIVVGDNWGVAHELDDEIDRPDEDDDIDEGEDDEEEEVA